MTEITLTIAIALYNGDKYIERCLNAIKAALRDKKGIEILIINDGSTDTSSNVIANYMKINPQLPIRTIYKDNGGLADVRNYSVEEANGEYLWLIDCDDTIPEDALSIILDNIVDKQDIYIYQYNIMDQAGSFIRGTSTFDCSLDINHCLKQMKHFTLNQFKQGLFFEPGSWHYVFKKELYTKNNIYFPKGRIYEDLSTTPKVMLQAKSISYINKKIYNYYLTPNSIIRDNSIKKRVVIIDALWDIKNYYIEQKVYQDYRDEIEYLFIKHIHYIYNSILKIADDPLLDRLTAFLKQEFPNWQKNKYFKQEKLKTRILYYLELNNLKIFLKFIHR